MTVAPTISIRIVCSPEQLADVQARVSVLRADLEQMGVAFSVRTPHDLATRRRACECPWCDRQLLDDQDQFCDLCHDDLAAGGERSYHGASG